MFLHPENSKSVRFSSLWLTKRRLAPSLATTVRKLAGKREAKRAQSKKESRPLAGKLRDRTEISLHCLSRLRCGKWNSDRERAAEGAGAECGMCISWQWNGERPQMDNHVWN